ncbi:MAG: hypothetical protein ACR2QE_18230 [Acidimicrobiales bacterium]
MDGQTSTACVIWSDFEWEYPSVLQPLARHLLAHGNQVIYVGPCRIDHFSLRRYLPPTRYYRQVDSVVRDRDGLTTIEPTLLRGRTQAVVRRLDTAAVKRRMLAHQGPAPDQRTVHFVTSPGWDTVPSVFVGDTVVQYVLDIELHGDGEQLTRDADEVWTVSPLLRSEKQRLRPGPVHLVPCFIDDSALDDPLPPASSAGPRPTVGYTGRVSDTRIDLELLDTVVRSRPDLSFVVRGFIDDDVAEAAVQRLDELDHFAYRGPVALGDVVGGMSDYDVTWIPYRDTPFNQRCNPSKMPQNLAAGMLTVVPDLAWAPLYDGVSVSFTTGDPDAASAAIDRALVVRADPQTSDRCRARAAELTTTHVLTPLFQRLGLARTPHSSPPE